MPKIMNLSSLVAVEDFEKYSELRTVEMVNVT
jgi:hypothetical protein